MKDIIDICNDYTYETVLPALMNGESFLMTLTDDDEKAEMVELVYSTMVMTARICIMRGWTPEEILKDIKHHVEEEYADTKDKVN